MFRRTLVSAAASLLLWTVWPATADPFDDAASGSLGGAHGVYLEDGRFLEAAPARQMTLRGHLIGFQYSPTGEKIAYESLVVDHGERFMAIKFVDPWRSEPIEKIVAKSMNLDTPTVGSLGMVSMVGWSGDGRYLVVQRLKTADGGALISDGDLVAAAGLDVNYECYDTQGDLTSPKVIAVGVLKPGSLPTFAWSPDQTRLLISANVRDPQAPQTDSEDHPLLTIYRLDSDNRQNIPLTSGQTALGWLDDHSLLFRAHPSAKGATAQYLRHEIDSGIEEAVAEPENWLSTPELRLGAGVSEPSPIDPKSRVLALDVIPQILPSSDRTDSVRASAIWLRNRTAKKKYAAMPIGVTPGVDSPQPQWSPAGDAVAFLAHGDLFVCDLAKRAATAREKLDAGEKLDCAEETVMAASNLRQIGLGILQYTQDNDELLPPASDVENRIYPYLKDYSLFTLGDSKFVYHAPKDLADANIASPATLVIGEINTTCARTVLYADGHVKSFNK